MENNPPSPQAFADQMLSLLGATPYWIAPTTKEIEVNQMADPANPARAVGAPNSGFSGAINAALDALRPGQGPLDSTARVVSQATSAVGESAERALEAGADTLKAAGGGISSGFKWAALLICLGLASYVFLLASPYIPKPQGAR